MLQQSLLHWLFNVLHVTLCVCNIWHPVYIVFQITFFVDAFCKVRSLKRWIIRKYKNWFRRCKTVCVNTFILMENFPDKLFKKFLTKLRRELVTDYYDFNTFDGKHYSDQFVRNINSSSQNYFIKKNQFILVAYRRAIFRLE